jgi:hypothetical protein
VRGVRRLAPYAILAAGLGVLSSCTPPVARAQHGVTPQLFPNWAALAPAGRDAAGHFTLLLQRWAGTERARVRREFPTRSCWSSTAPITTYSSPIGP